MPPKPKTLAEKALLREKIIDTARDLFVNMGVEAVTMREIAKRIGYSATTLYLYFEDKEALIKAICDIDLLKLATIFNEVLSIKDPVERMMHFGQAYAKFALNYPNHYRMIFMTPHPPRCESSTSIVQKNNLEQDAYFQLKTVVNDVFEAGQFRAEIQDPELAAQTIWAAMHGVCSLEIIMAKDEWINWSTIEARVEAVLSMVARGMLKEVYV